MSESLAYFELRPEIGEHPDDPLQSISAPVQVPMMVGREVAEGTEVHIITQRPKLDPGYSARVIPGTRIVEVRDRLLRDFFEKDARFTPCDPPSKAKQDRQKRAATERAASTTTAKEQ